MTEFTRNEDGNVVGVKHTLSRIAEDSTPSSQDQTFNAGDEAELGPVTRAGVQQTMGSNQISVTASSDVDFATTPHVTDAAGRMVTDASKARPDSKVKVGDVEVTFGNALQQGWVEVQNGQIVYTEEGEQFALNRAANRIEREEGTASTGSCLDNNSQVALSMLDRATAGRFLSSYLPSILHDHIDGKGPSFEAVQALTQATGQSEEVLSGMLSEICTKALDRGAREVGRLEGLNGSQVHRMVENASNATKKRWLVAVTMGVTPRGLRVC